MLLGTSNLPPHNIGFAIGNKNKSIEKGNYNICEVVIRFFKIILPTNVDGKIGLYYSDIIKYFFHKIILYMGHSVRCKAQQVRIKEILALSKGNTTTIIIDYMMKWEEDTARESTREHYGNR